MNLDDIPLFSMLRGRLGYLNQRQQLVAQNIANADTPGYTPRDLKAFTFESHLKGVRSVGSAGAAGAMSTSDPRHLHASSSSSASSASGFRSEQTPDSETTLNGNQVVLEEEMMKMSEARVNYEAAIGFYQKSLTLLRMASRPPGR